MRLHAPLSEKEPKKSCPVRAGAARGKAGRDEFRMRVRDIMTRPVVTVQASMSVRVAARKMRDCGIGILPVVEAGRLVGMISDRDITVRMVSESKSAESVAAAEVMSPGVLHCFEDQTIEEVAGLMGDHQVRRMPVLDRSGRLVGIVSMGDIAEDASEILAGEALGEVVEDR